MTGPLVLPFPGEDARARDLAQRWGGAVGALTIHRFPDGESLVTVDPAVAGRVVVVVCSLDRPDPKLIPLLFTLRTARELGAAAIGLVAPYLCYLRQDRRFEPGQAVAARLFAQMLGPHLDWLVTVDPHLHRIHTLPEVYTIPTMVVHAAPVVADWVMAYVPDPVFIGPDEESAQWVAELAARAGAPSLVLRKERHGDHDVDVTLSAPMDEPLRACTPVLYDDILSTGRTLAATAVQLRARGMKPPVVVVVHALFAEGSMEALAAAGVKEVVSVDTVRHPTNRIGMTGGLAAAGAAFVNRSG